ncbi:MAG: aldo/keto reductase [Acidobacteriia bacterium]|jgi:aryl-alcohol dehydrogenase-like predicted oxidoreductase|nr:aldo/keto reductase [Terriglobia bacterium]
MQYTCLGNTGLKVSRLCLGMMTYGSKQWRPWVLDEEESLPFIREALEVGINFFDTADMYSLGRSEEILGQAMKEFGPGRDRVVIATKVFNEMNSDPNGRGLSRKHIMHSIDESLKRLKTDYVDLYQIHRFDYQTPIEETLSALHDVVKAGKALYIGASAMYAWQFMKMLGTSDRLGLTRFVSMQNCYNLLYREEEREMLPLCREEGIGVIPFSPLARGFIAGNRNREKSGDTLRAQSDDLSRSYFFTEQDFALVDRITEVAERLGTSNARLAMAWVLQQPGITSPIIGATKPHHISDAVAALELKLDESDLQSLTDPYKPRPIMAHS